MEKLWLEVQSNLAKVLTPQTYATWTKPIRYLGIAADTLELEVPNRFVKDWVTESYLGMLQEAVCTLAGTRYRIEFHINEAAVAPAESR